MACSFRVEGELAAERAVVAGQLPVEPVPPSSVKRAAYSLLRPSPSGVQTTVQFGETPWAVALVLGRTGL